MSRHEDYMKLMGEKEKKDNVVDMVNSPPHYNQSDIECIDAIKAMLGPNFKYYLQGNALKYLWRFDHKDKPAQDVDKGIWYMNKLRKEVSKNDKS